MSSNLLRHRRWGRYGGFYLHPRRICIGWVALTLIPAVEIDDLMAAYVGVPIEEIRDA